MVEALRKCRVVRGVKMRLVSREANAIIGANSDSPANFGLAFDKWLIFDGVDPLAKRQKQSLLDSYGKSVRFASEVLKQRHIKQAAYCQAMAKAGWRPFIVHARLISSFISGLGMTHPTETGMVLDHASGLPYIPAAGQKGVLRLAHMINSLCDEDGNWLSEETLERLDNISRHQNGNLLWDEDNASKTLFGTGGDRDGTALAGQMVVLDAYPLTPPGLGEEILNPHYMKYYSGERGPTEDQNPVPVKFLVVKQDAEFVFRILLRSPLHKAPEKDQERLADLVVMNLRRALCEEGVGAKTALGFGRFAIIANAEPDVIGLWQDEQQEKEEKIRFPWKAAAREIKKVGDWGQLSQLLEKEDVKKYRSRFEIGRAIQDVANHIRNDKPKKWKEERDRVLSDWLMPSGVVWESLDEEIPSESSLSSEEQEAVERIEKLGDWGAWLNCGMNTQSLPPVALEKLRDKFKEWGCDAKKAKAAKKKAWNALLKQLHSK